jgi:bifunctional enzyme CysN/CysC
VLVQSVERVIDSSTLAMVPDGILERDGVADIVLRSRDLLALDDYRTNQKTGRFVLLDGAVVAGGGTIDMDGYPDRRAGLLRKGTNLTAVTLKVTPAMRAARSRHRGGVLWLTGLSGSGKSTLAVAAEQRLFELGYQVYVLDGDNVRRGLNANLGFSPEDRSENIRRVGEVAALFADAGTVLLSAFISPYRDDRERARAAAAALGVPFHEIHVSADLTVCERRDPKGLYRLARAGKLAEFTGVSAPYEAPGAADLVIDTANQPVEQSVTVLIDYVERNFRVV